jgi:hypothetical protein
MAERWLRSRSGTRDEEFRQRNVDLDSNSKYLEADITVTANTAVEGGVQNS